MALNRYARRPRPSLKADHPAVHRSEPKVAGLRVLVIGHDYAPDVIGIAPYTTETCEWLAKCGADVTVLTMPPHYPQWRVPVGVSRGYSSERLRDVRVIRVPTYVPADPTLLRRLAFEGSWALAAMPSVARQEVSRADVIVGVHPGLFASSAAAGLSALLRIPCVQIVQDLVGQAAEQSSMGGAARVGGPLRRMESWALRSAESVIVPTPAFLPSLSGLGVSAERIHVVPNWTRVVVARRNRAVHRRRLGWSDHHVVLHAGNIGLKQALELFVPTIRASAAALPDVRFVFVGGGSRSEVLRREVVGLQNVEMRPTASEEEFESILVAADSLLLHERDTVRDMCLPSKLTTYFAAGRAVVAVTSPNSATAAEVNRSGGGVVVPPGRPEDFVAAVRELRTQEGYADRLAAAGLRHSRENLSREKALTQIEHWVASAAVGGRLQAGEIA
jgi:colanic acid biosynthesis glycosyl transferase WcaI